MAIGTPFLAGAATEQGTVTATLTVPVTTPVPLGNVIVVGAATSGAQTVASVTDSAGNTYAVQANEHSGTGVNTFIFVALNAIALTTSSTITVSYSATAAAAKNALAISCSGILATGAVDAAASVTGTNAGSTAPSATTGTLGNASELIVAFESNGSGGGAITWAAGLTSQGSQETAGQAFTGAATKVTSSTAPVTMSGTITSAKWSVVVVGLQGAASVVSGTASLAGGGTLSAKSGLRAKPAALAGAGTLACTPGVRGLTPISLRGAAAFPTSGGTTTMSVTKTPGTTAGDLILIWCACGVGAMTWSSSGFNAVTAASGVNGSAQLLWRTADGTEGAAFTVVMSVSHSWAPVIATYTTQNRKAPFDGTPGSGQINTASLSVAAGSITTEETGDQLVWFAFSQATSPAVPQVITPPGGYTTRVTQAFSTASNASVVGVTMADFTQGDPGTTGTVAGTVPAASVSGAVVIAVSPVSAVLTGAGTLSATPRTGQRISLAGAGSLVPKVTQRTAPGTLAGAGALAVRGVIRGTVTLTGAGTVTAAGHMGGTILRGAGTLSARPSQGPRPSLAGAATLSVSGRAVRVTFLSGAGVLAVTPGILWSASLKGAGTLSVRPRQSPRTVLTGAGTLVPRNIVHGTASLHGAGAVTFTSAPATPGRAALHGAGTLTAAARIPGHAVLAGAGQIRPLGALRGAAALHGAAVITERGVIRGRVTLTGAAHLTPHPTMRLAQHLAGAAVGRVAASNAAVSSFITQAQRPMYVRRVYLAAAIPTTLASSVIAGDVGVRRISLDFVPGGSNTPAQLQAFLLDCRKNGLSPADMIISLWHEMTSKFSTAADYISAVIPYAQAVHAAGYMHAWCPTNYSLVHNGAESWYPGDQYVDVICVDYYCQGSAPGAAGGDTLDMAGSFADTHKKPLGILEFNGDQVSGTTTEAQGDAFLSYFYSFFQGRVKANKPCSDLLYFDSGSNKLENGPASYTTWYQKINDLFANSSQLTAAGTLSAVGRVTGRATISGTASLRAAGSIKTLARASLQGAGRLSAVATVPVRLTSHVAGAATLSAAWHIRQPGRAVLTAAGTLAPAGSSGMPPLQSGIATLAGAGIVHLRVIIGGSAQLAGTSFIESGVLQQALVTLAGSGSLSGQLTMKGTAQLTGAATFGTTPVLNGSVIMRGASSLSPGVSQQGLVSLGEVSSLRASSGQRSHASLQGASVLSVRGRQRAVAFLRGTGTLVSAPHFTARTVLAAGGSLAVQFRIIVHEVATPGQEGQGRLSATATVISPVDQPAFTVDRFEIIRSVLIPDPDGHDEPLDPRQTGRPVT